MSDKLVEVIKETKIGQEPWYEIRVDGAFVCGFYNIDKAMAVYADIKQRNVPVLTREILISEKI